MKNNCNWHHNVDDKFWLAFSVSLIDNLFGKLPNSEANLMNNENEMKIHSVASYRPLNSIVQNRIPVV